MKEEWRPVVGYEGLYEVSNRGRVRGVERKVRVKGGGIRLIKGNVLKVKTNRRGYKVIGLRGKKERKFKLVHILVAEAFIRPREMIRVKTGRLLPEPIHHKDNNPLNNNVENLEWSTYFDNSKYAIEDGLLVPINFRMRYGEDHPVSKYSRNQVVMAKELWRDGGSHKEISKITGISFGALRGILRENIWKDVKVEGFNSKKYSRKGETNRKAKLTEGQVVEIRRMSCEGQMGKDIAVFFNVSPSAVGAILRGESWKHVEG